MAEVEWSKTGVECLEALDGSIQKRILNKLDEATEWPNHRLEPLVGYPYYKLRAGDYRVILDWGREEETLLVCAVGHRRNVSDRHLPP